MDQKEADPKKDNTRIAPFVFISIMVILVGIVFVIQDRTITGYISMDVLEKDIDANLDGPAAFMIDKLTDAPIQSLRITGQVVGEGEVSSYLMTDDGEMLLIYTNKGMTGPRFITGWATAEDVSDEDTDVRPPQEEDLLKTGSDFSGMETREGTIDNKRFIITAPKRSDDPVEERADDSQDPVDGSQPSLLSGALTADTPEDEEVSEADEDEEKLDVNIEQVTVHIEKTAPDEDEDVMIEADEAVKKACVDTCNLDPELEPYAIVFYMDDCTYFELDSVTLIGYKT